MPPAQRNMMTSTPFAFGGGLDLTSSAIAVPGGRVIAAMNYEPVVGGYSLVQGYERFDGRKASEAQVYKLPFNTGTVAPLAGSTITGATSGATANLLTVDGVTGTYAGGNAAGTLVLCEIVGVFMNGEVLKFGATPFAHAADIAAIITNPSDPLYTWKSSAEFRRRPLIQPPPGSGPVRGGFVFNGSVYVIRDNVGATQGVMYKATTAGWVAQAFGRWMKFTSGLVAIAEGSTITGGTSGATAHVERVVVQTGEWGAALAVDQAAGTLVLSGQVGAFVVGETLKVGGVNSATNNQGGDSTVVQLTAGGRYHCKVKNFYGATNRQRVYLANGVNVAVEYDGGSVMVPIFTGTPVDHPTRVFDIGNALGLTFPGGSIQISAPGEPCVFNAILGALELAIGDDITDVIDSTDDAVVFFAKNKVATLTGRSVDDFVLSEITEEAGALPWTVQRVGKTLYLDNRGLRDLTATAAWGNFKAGAISELFDNYLANRRNAGVTPVGALRCKTKTQYRLYYSDGSGFTVYMGGKAPQMLPFKLNLPPYALFSGELADGSEGLFATDTSGQVVQLDSGTDFDGQFFSYFAMTPFNHLGNIAMNKRFESVAIEGNFPVGTSIGVLAQFDYGDGEEPGENVGSLLKAGGGSFAQVDDGTGHGTKIPWDPSSWATFNFQAGSGFQGMVEADIAGAGRNVSLIIGGSSGSPTPPHTLESYTVRWVARGQVKRTAR